MKKIKYLSPETEVIKIENVIMAAESEDGNSDTYMSKRKYSFHEESYTRPSSADGVSGRDYSPWE